MRSLRAAIVLGLTALLGAPLGVSAQALPEEPVPYSQIRPKRPPAKRPSAPAPAAPTQDPAAAATGPAVAGAPAVAAVPRPPGSRFAPGQPLPPAELEAFADGWITDAMSRTHVPGAAVSVVQNGQVVLKKGYGFADQARRKAVDPDRTLFRVASISKTFTWILLMKEVEAGRIRLDRPINLYLPERVRVRDDGWSRDVLVRNLMDHTPGFEDRALGQLFERDARQVRPLDLWLRQERPARVRGAGVAPAYSNYGSALAGQAVSFVSGKTFERRVEEEITGPLGMTRTTFREPRDARRGLPLPMHESLRDDVAVGYRWTATGYQPRPFEFVGHAAPAGAASSTAGDMTRYMLALLGDGTWNGVTIFGPRAARAFRSPLHRTPDGLNGWAHGFVVSTLPGGFKGYGHDGATIAFHSQLIVVPQLNLGVFITTNGDSGYQVAGQFADRLVRHFYAEPAVFPRPGSRELAERADDYEGAYLSTRRAYSGLEGLVMLYSAGGEVSVTPDGRLVTSGGGETRTWVPEGPLEEGRFIASLGDARLFFRIRDGKALSFRTGGNAAVMERAPFWETLSTLSLLGALTAAAAVATLAGVLMRNRRDHRENPMQARAALVQNIQAGLWLATLGLFVGWAMAAIGDEAKAVFEWPNAMVTIASSCALVATALNLLTLAALPAVWQGGRRVDSWTPLRKAFFTVTVLIYTAFALVLGLNGGLAPWSA
jgi:CubicO group peptidase (beta-lactamase class C family)